MADVQALRPSDSFSVPVAAPTAKRRSAWRLGFDQMAPAPIHVPLEQIYNASINVLAHYAADHNGIPGFPFAVRLPDGTIRDVIRNRAVVYSIYYHDAGFADRTGAGIDSGQNYLTQLCQAAGGEFFYQGTGNPVDFTPFQVVSQGARSKRARIEHVPSQRRRILHQDPALSEPLPERLRDRRGGRAPPDVTRADRPRRHRPPGGRRSRLPERQRDLPGRAHLGSRPVRA